MALQSGNYIVDTDVDNWPNGTSDADKLLTIELVEDLIERITRDYFYAKAFSEVFNGNGKDRLWLHLNPNILTITEVTLSEIVLSDVLYSFDKESIFRAALTSSQVKDIEGITLNSTDPVSVNVTGHGFVSSMVARLISVVGITPSLDNDYTVTKVDDDNYTLNGTDSSDYTGSFVSGTSSFASLAELYYLTNSRNGRFPKGTMNVAITGTYGWAVVPPAIKKAAIILARSENDGTLYTKYDDLVSDKLGDAAITRGQKTFLTGVQEADRLIRMYIRKKTLINAV